MGGVSATIDALTSYQLTHKDTHFLWLWRYPKGMFCVGVTVQRGLACLKAGNGDGGVGGYVGVLASGSVCSQTHQRS